MKKQYIYLVITILITAFIFANSAQSAEVSSQASDGLLSIVIRFLPFLTSHSIRKCAHFTEFFAQGFSLSMYFENTPHRLRKRLPAAAVCCLATACLDELSQHFSAGRSPQLSDVAIDFCGSAAAIFTVLLVSAYKKRRD